MIAYRRRDALLDALSRTGSLTVRHAADQLGVSEVTIRNDLALLEQQGCLRRVHGGAVRVVRADMTAFPGATPAGTVVASRAATMVEDGEAIVIAAGRMGEQLARALAGRTNLSVITNSLEVASILAQERSNTVIIAGGVVQASGAVYIDALTNQGLGHLRSVRAFVPAAHLTPSAGLLADSLEQAATLRTLVGLADSLVILLDRDGEAGQGLARVVSLEQIDHVIVDQHAPVPLVDALRSAGITVSLCGASVITVPPRTGSQRTFKVAFANLSETELFTVEVQRGLEYAGQRAGNIELLLADNRADGETALRNAEHFIAQQADLVIEYQVDERYAYRLMHRLRLARIPVIAVDIPHPGATYFGVDNYVAGRLAGEAVAQEVVLRWDGCLDRLFTLGLPQSGQVVAARLQGQIDAIREYLPLAPNQITWLDSRNTQQTAYQQLREALREVEVGQRLVLTAVNDETMLGGIAALEEMGHAAYAIAASQGADRLALAELLRPGTPLIGAVAFRPETYGERLIALAESILSGAEVPPAVYQQHDLIRQSSAGSYLDALRAADLERHSAGAKVTASPTAGG